MRGHIAIITKLSPHYVPTESTISGCDVVLIPGLLPIFLHGCDIKSGWGLGTWLTYVITVLVLVRSLPIHYIVVKLLIVCAIKDLTHTHLVTVVSVLIN